MGFRNPDDRREYHREWQRRNKDKTREYQKRYIAKNGRPGYAERLAWYESEKSNPCEDCGQSFPAPAMDFHHTEDKNFSLNLWSVNNYGLAKLQEEREKCVLLCAVCHRLRHKPVVSVGI